ncbi:MAG TPA: HAMP domain-containing sensor histidine kinase [Polyangia bacterium]
MSRRSDPLLRSLTAATVGIVVAFVASSLWSEARLRRLDEAARELAYQIAPRIECLSRVRGTMHGLEDASDAARASLQQRLQSEARACAAGATVMPLLAASDFAGADHQLQRLIVAEADRAARVGPTIVEERVRAERTAIAVHCLAAVVALLGIGMVWLTGRADQRAARAHAAIDDRERRHAVERARELDLFASRVAHDLKAPLSAVAFYISAADGSAISQKGSASISQTVTGAIELVDALLDYARAGSGQELPEAEADVLEVVEHVISSLDVGARCRATIAVAPGLAVACSRGALRSVLANFVRNALEHGIVAGGHEIAVEASLRDGRARIEVSDDGPGVAAELRARIFEPYFRGDAQSKAGLGLGLATVRRIAEQCAGAVGVEPSDRGGARFWIELPAALTRPAASASSSASA